MGIKTFPFIHRGNFVVTGTLRVDASAYFTGKVEAATGIAGDASLDVALHIDCATGMDVCGPVVCATAVTVCGAAQ